MSYGVHSTRYTNLSNEELYSMYRESAYSQLREEEKLDLVQETVNRDAVERGEIGSPEVRFIDLPVNESGNTADGVININRDMAVFGIQSCEYKGRVINHNIEDYNIQTLNTAIHENTHCIQSQIVDGIIDTDDLQMKSEYEANDFTCSPVCLYGNTQLGCHYLVGESPMGYYLYYFQPTERDAYLRAEEKTGEILNYITAKYGNEHSFEQYNKSVETTGYQVREQEAIQLFNNPNFKNDLSQVLQNQYFKTDKLVDQRTEAMVKAEMIVSYNSLIQEISMNMEEKNMSFDPKPVSLQQYNESLRDSVNAFYEHSVNDNLISNDEAVNETAQMSENYLAAIEEFQDAQLQSDGIEAYSEMDIDEEGISSIEGDGIDDGGVEEGGLEEEGLGL